MKEWLILIVDENPDDLKSLSTCFSPDYQIIAARSGKEALDFLETTDADVILSNLHIKDMSGLDLFGQSRLPGALRSRRTSQGRHFVRDRRRGQTAQVPSLVSRQRTCDPEQDRPAAVREVRR